MKKDNKKILLELKAFFENRDGWDLDEVIDDIADEIGLAKLGCSLDECSIECGNEYIWELDDFIDIYTVTFLKKVCNVIDSYIKEIEREENKMECKKCGISKNETHFYKYFNELYCFDCLLEEMGIESYIVTNYTLDCEYLGDDDDIVDVLKEYGVEEIESEV